MSDLRFRLPENVDSTMLNGFRVCPQRFAFEYGFGLRDPKPSVDLVAGGAFASAREALYRAAHRGLPRIEALAEARKVFDVAWSGFERNPESKSPKTPAQTWAALVEYANTFDPANDRLKPIAQPDDAFEWRFRLTLDPETTGLDDWPRHPETGAYFGYAGRLDAVGLLDGSLPVVLDDKTTSRFEAVPTWVAGLQMRAQLIGYTWAVQKLLRPDCDHAIVRQTAIRTNSVECRESPLLPMSKFLVQRWLRTTRETLRSIVRATEAGAFEAVLGDACTSWSRVCEFASACRSAEPEAHLEGFVERRWNPLAGDGAVAEGAP